MPWRDALEPTRMQRVALVAPHDELRRVLAAVADAGVVEFERFEETQLGPATEAWQRAERELRDPGVSAMAPALAPDAPDVGALARDHRLAELAGEAQLEQVSASAVDRGAVAAFAGWSPAAAVNPLADRLRPLGGAVVALPMPRGRRAAHARGGGWRDRCLPAARRHVRHRALRRSESLGVRRARVRRHVRDDVRRRRARAASARCGPGAVGAAPGTPGPLPMGGTVRHRCRAGERGVRACLRRRLRPHRTGPGALARAPRPRHHAAGGGCRRRGRPARRVLRFRHRQPVARGRRRARARGRVGRGRRRHVRRRRARRPRVVPARRGARESVAARSRSEASCSGSSGSTSRPGARIGRDAGRRGALRCRRAPRHQHGVVRPARRVRAHPRCARQRGVVGDERVVAPGPGAVGGGGPRCSSPATPSPSCSRGSWPESRPCASSTTSCSPASSPPRAGRSGRGTSRSSHRRRNHVRLADRPSHPRRGGPRRRSPVAPAPQTGAAGHDHPQRRAAPRSGRARRSWPCRPLPGAAATTVAAATKASSGQALIGAAIAVSGSSIGAGIGIAYTGSAAWPP